MRIIESNIVAVKEVNSNIHREGRMSVLLQMDYEVQLGFGVNRKSMTNTRKRSRTLIVNDVRIGASMEEVTEFYSDCRIARKIASKPIVEDNDAWAIEQGFITLENVADRQLVVFKDENGDLVPASDKYGKPYYEAFYIDYRDESGADVDEREVPAGVSE